MQQNSVGKVVTPENQLLIYISDQPPGQDWRHFASSHNWEMLHHSDLLSALGAFIMLLPGVVVIDRRSAVGNAALSHIEDVLYITPQPTLMIVELGVPDCMARYGSVVRLGAGSDALPMSVFSRMSG